MTIGIVLAYVTWQIGLKSGSARYWRWVTAGMIVVSAGRLILAFAEAVQIDFVPDWLSLKDIGLYTMLAATLCMLVGFRGFLKEIMKAGSHGSRQ